MFLICLSLFVFLPPPGGGANLTFFERRSLRRRDRRRRHVAHPGGEIVGIARTDLGAGAIFVFGFVAIPIVPVLPLAPPFHFLQRALPRFPVGDFLVLDSFAGNEAVLADGTPLLALAQPSHQALLVINVLAVRVAAEHDDVSRLVLLEAQRAGSVHAPPLRGDPFFVVVTVRRVLYRGGQIKPEGGGPRRSSLEQMGLFDDLRLLENIIKETKNRKCGQ